MFALYILYMYLIGLILKKVRNRWSEWVKLHSEFVEDVKEWVRKVCTSGMLWMCIATVVVCICANSFWSWWIEWFGKEIDESYNFIVSHYGLPLILILALGWIAISSWRKLWRSSPVNILTLPVAICALWLINAWPGRFMPIWGIVTIKYLLWIWIGVGIGIEVVKTIIPFLEAYKLRDNQNDKEPGLSVGHPDYYEDGRKKFAASLASIIENSDLKQRGATIGITGEWGSGKTVVIREIKSALKDKMDVIEFFPWQSTSVQNLIEDFFQTLASHLHSESRNLGRELENYADKLISLDIDKRLNRVAKISRWLLGGYLSINDARNRIEQDLKKLKRGIVVIIDDLDRLDKDELFETLRLVRNTAHFSNIVYIIAYDPDYTARMLERKGIENAREYLHKIFMISLGLPGYEQFTYAEVLRRVIGNHFDKESEDFKLLESLILRIDEADNSRYFLSRFILNYRSAVQLGYFLSTNYILLKKMDPDFRQNFIIDDWFYLKVLHFFYPEAYNLLHHQPEAFFVIDYSRYPVVFKYDEDTFNKSGIKVASGALDLIRHMFRQLPSDIKPGGIAYEGNFYNYFASRVLSTELSEKDFMDMLNGNRPQSIMMMEWIQRKPRIWSSVDLNMASHNIAILNEQQIRNYVSGLMWWNALTGSYTCLRVIRELTYHSSISYENIETARETYTATLESIIGNPAIRAEAVARLITAQSPYPDDPSISGDEYEAPIFLLEDDSAYKVFSTLIKREFDNERIKSADDISDPESSLFRIMNAAYTSIEMDAGEYLLFRNYALKPIGDFFREKLKTGDQLKGKKLNQFKAAFSAQYTGVEEIDADAEENSDRLRRSFFENRENMEQIIDEWFEGKQEEKDALKKDLK